MPKRVSGRRYAEAIFELALQEDQVEQWATELELVSQVLQDEDFSGFLKHADVPVDQKIKSIDSVLAQVHPLVRNMAKLLVSKGLVDLAGELQEAFAGEAEMVDALAAGATRLDIGADLLADRHALQNVRHRISDPS